ncbi:pre-mRNA-splicing factor cwc22, partial [Aphelenchoides avenae]
MTRKQIAGKNSEQIQRMSWMPTKEKSHAQVKKANTGNIVTVVRELFQRTLFAG